MTQRDVRRRALGAEPAEVRRVLGIARYLDHLAALDMQHHPAAAAEAVTA
ncbi:hypothetical protein PPH41_21025 [Burkholderia gladioli]|nr:hypothetical protein [Burkholderia gladioli]